jgi:hypothetical protein
MFLFNVVQPMFEMFGWYHYPPGNLIMLDAGIKQDISDAALAETYKVIITMLLGTSVGWLIGILKFNLYNPKRNNSLSNVIAENKNLFKYLFFILLPWIIIYNSMLLYYTTIFGYVAVMHLQVGNENIPLFLRVVEVIYPVMGYSMLFYAESKKEYIRYAVLFMLPYSIQIFTGLRGEATAMLFTVLFIYSRYFGQIKLKYILLGGLPVFLLAQAIGVYRFTGVVGIDHLFNLSIFDFIVLGIASYGSSMGVIAYTIELNDYFFNKVPFLFGYIQAIFSFAPNYTYEGIQNKNYLAQHITYLLDPDKLYRGSTIGTAMGAEFYEFSNGYMIFIFILSIILLYCACYFIKNLFKNQFMFYIGAMYMGTLFLSPRGSIMKILNKESVFCMAILIFVVLLSRSRQKPIQNKE